MTNTLKRVVPTIVMAFALLALAVPAQADPGTYRYDICHDTGADRIVGDNFNFEVTCSADYSVAGGDGVTVQALVEVVVTNPSGTPIVFQYMDTQPTGAAVSETGHGPTEWVDIDGELQIQVIPGYEECELFNIAGFCNEEIDPVAVVVPTGAEVDTGEWTVDTYHGLGGGFVTVWVCANGGDCPQGSPIKTNLLP